MPALENPKWEHFAQALAKGKTQIEAYAEAGYRPNDANATRLTGNDRIKARVAELQERMAYKSEITIEKIEQMLIEDREFARSVNQAGAARAATETLAKLRGYMVERKEVRTGPLEEVQPDELDRLRSELVAERARRAAGGNGTEAGRKPH